MPNASHVGRKVWCGMAKIRATVSDVEDGTLGACRHCGEVQDGCEPDARNYTCEACGMAEVFGFEELVVMGEVEIVEDNDDAEDEE